MRQFKRIRVAFGSILRVLAAVTTSLRAATTRPQALLPEPIALEAAPDSPRSWFRRAAIGGCTILGITGLSFAVQPTLAAFTARASQTQGAVSTGTVNLTATPSANFSVGVSNLAPGDSVQRTLNLSSTTTLTLTSVKLTTASAGNPLLFDPVANGAPSADGLTLAIDACSASWTASGSTFTCSGTGVVQSVVLASTVIKQPVAGTTLNNLTVLSAGSHTDFLRFTVGLPAAGGDNQTQSKSATISYSFTATQRAGGQFK